MTLFWWTQDGVRKLLTSGKKLASHVRCCCSYRLENCLPPGVPCSNCSDPNEARTKYLLTWSGITPCCAYPYGMWFPSGFPSSGQLILDQPYGYPCSWRNATQYYDVDIYCGDEDCEGTPDGSLSIQHDFHLNLYTVPGPGGFALYISDWEGHGSDARYHEICGGDPQPYPGKTYYFYDEVETFDCGATLNFTNRITSRTDPDNPGDYVGGYGGTATVTPIPADLVVHLTNELSDYIGKVVKIAGECFWVNELVEGYGDVAFHATIDGIYDTCEECLGE